VQKALCGLSHAVSEGISVLYFEACKEEEDHKDDQQDGRASSIQVVRYRRFFPITALKNVPIVQQTLRLCNRDQPK